MMTFEEWVKKINEIAKENPEWGKLPVGTFSDWSGRVEPPIFPRLEEDEIIDIKRGKETFISV